MIVSLIYRQNLHYQTFTLYSLHHHFSTSSKLHSKYTFTPPKSLQPQNPNPNPQYSSNPHSPHKIRKKPLYRPPSSLEAVDKPLQSKLPFDFRYSYTESNPSVRPIGLRGPKYSPFGPGRLSREWTGVCAPVKSLKVKTVDGEVEDDTKLAEGRRIIREKLQGAPLTDAERKILVDNCQRSKTKRQINLGNFLFAFKVFDEMHS